MSFLYMGKEDRSGGSKNDVLIGEETIGGPLTGKDVRLYLGDDMLEHLLELSRTSPVRRVQIDSVGIRVRTWRDSHGHTYQTWQIIGHKPRAESHALFGSQNV